MTLFIITCPVMFLMEVIRHFFESLPVGKNVAPIYPEFVIENKSHNDGRHIEHINNYPEKISSHEFFKWLINTSIDPQLKLKSFIPLWIVDIMGYRDINKYVFYI